jgi:hypothetical protein
MKTLRRTILTVLIMAFFLVLGGMIFLDDYYYRTGSRLLDEKAGKIYPRNVKGFGGVGKVYLTHTQELPYEYDWYVAVILAVAAFTLNQRWRCFPPFSSRRNRAWSRANRN